MKASYLVVLIFNFKNNKISMVTIVFSHPWHGSFNKAILDTITAKYDNGNTPYQVIDLNKDKFNPVMTEEELAGYSKGEYKDPLVGKYQAMLRNTTEIIIMYPMWWMDVPAILKGFFDKVMLMNFAFNYQNGWTTLLNNIKKATVITTSEQATADFAQSGDTVNDFIKNSLYSIGVNEAIWFNCEHTPSGTDAHRQKFLQTIESNV